MSWHVEDSLPVIDIVHHSGSCAEVVVIFDTAALLTRRGLSRLACMRTKFPRKDLASFSHPGVGRKQSMRRRSRDLRQLSGIPMFKTGRVKDSASSSPLEELPPWCRPLPGCKSSPLGRIFYPARGPIHVTIKQNSFADYAVGDVRARPGEDACRGVGRRSWSPCTRSRSLH